jgi:tripartite-type tricarboxylate transporter receptor subunit TctC
MRTPVNITRTTIATLAIVCADGFAQSGGAVDYPSRPVRLIIPYSPGGASDNISRQVMPKLSDQLKQTIVIDNRPGGAGNIGRELGAKAVPDGYTLYLADAPHVITPHVVPKLPFDPLKDFTPISIMATAPLIIIVNPSFPAKTVGELVALAKAHPGKYNYGSGGTGATTHLTGEMFRLAAGINIVHVPYKSIAPAVTDLIGNQIPIAFPGFATVGGHLRAGRVRALAVAAHKRAAAFPDIPTFEEAGVPGVISQNWFGIMGPRGLPRPIAEKLHVELVRAVRHPDVQKWLANSSIESVANTPDEFSRHLEAEFQRWGRVVKAAGVKVEQ